MLPVLILLSMVTGTLVSIYKPKTKDIFDGRKFLNVSIPLLVGLMIMMIPPICKIEWENIHKLILKRKKLKIIIYSIILNWIVCPFIMFGLAWLILYNEKEYRNGIIMIGIARCIAMVLIWNDIAQGDNELCAILIIINSLLQLALYAPYQILFCYLITGDKYQEMNTYPTIVKVVAFFLGVPMLIGIVIRILGIKINKKIYIEKIIPIINPLALIGLLYTILIIFVERGDEFIKDIRTAFKCFIPLILYFLITWFGTFFTIRYLTSNTEYERICDCKDDKDKWVKNCGANYEETIAQTFVASSNNFELSLSIAIALYGSGSKESIAATFGPLIEVPILLILTFIARYFKVKFIWKDE